MKALFIVTCVLGLSACSNSLAPLSGCESNNELTVYCGFQNPEDLALTPDGQALIVSEFGGMTPLAAMQPGQLSMFDLTNKVKQPLPIVFESNTWGEATCQRDAALPFGPHGIDLVQRDDGRWQLAMVSHVPYESVELFELTLKEAWTLTWRGCVKGEGVYYFNDVALNPSGGFYATHMFARETSIFEVVWYVLSRVVTGSVVSWEQAQGFNELAFTQGSFPNGIALDHANARLVVNYNTGDETVMFDLASKDVVGRYQHNSPDNVVIKEGFVWVTNHDHAATDTFACAKTPNCPLPFSVNQLSLEDLSLVRAFPFESTNMGTGTVGLPHQGSLWIGSYHSDRLGQAVFSATDLSQ
jgi:hypothetical protein